MTNRKFDDCTNVILSVTFTFDPMTLKFKWTYAITLTMDSMYFPAVPDHNNRTDLCIAVQV